MNCSTFVVVSLLISSFINIHAKELADSESSGITTPYTEVKLKARGKVGSDRYKIVAEKDAGTVRLALEKEVESSTQMSLFSTLSEGDDLSPPIPLDVHSTISFMFPEPVPLRDTHTGSWKNHSFGTGRVYFSGIEGDPDFTVENNTCVNGNQYSCDMDILFSPTTEGFKTAVLRKRIDRMEGNSHYFTLIISGIALEMDFDPEEKVCKRGSEVSIDGRSLIERVPVTGCDFDLVYSSNRSPDYWTTYTNPVRVNPFNPEGWTISSLHFYNKEENNLFLGSGAYLPRKHSVQADGNVLVANDDEVYIFAPDGKHLETRSALTGYVKNSFHYSSDNKIIKIVDAFNKETLFNRNSAGVLTSIVSPYGEVSNLTVDENNRINQVTNPNNESYIATYHDGDDFMQSFIKPSGLSSTFTYQGPGFLETDEGIGGNLWNLTFEAEDNAQKTELTSKMGRSSAFITDRDLETGVYTRIQRSPEGFVSTYTEGSDRSKTMTNDFETKSTTTINDERFGELLSREHVKTQIIAGITRTVEHLQSADLSDPNNPFSYSELVNTLRINGIDTISTFNKANMMSTVVDPAGVQTKIQLDSFERPTSIQLGSDIPLSISYDSAGRVAQTAQGDQAQATYLYDERGNLQSVTNALGQKTSYEYDLSNRPVRITANDGTSIQMQYNADGKILGVTPSSRPTHLFSYNLLDVTESYEPPALTDVPAPATTYDYNLDKQLTGINRPDGQNISLIYNDTTGLLESMANQTYSYIPETNLVSSINSPDEVLSEFSYFGTEQVASEKQTFSGQSSEVAFSFDNFFRPFRRVIKLGENIIGDIVTTFRNDGKVAQVGAMTLGYDPTSGRLSETQLDNIKDYRSYDAYGNLQSYQAVVINNGQEETLYSYTLERDALQRIVAKEEVLNGIIDRYEYVFDDQGRLTSVSKNGAVYSSYVHDLAGNIVSGMMNGTNFNATYDEQDRLLSWTEAASSMLMASASTTTSTQSVNLLSETKDSKKKNKNVKKQHKHDKKAKKFVKHLFSHLKHHKHKHLKRKHCLEDRHDRGKHLGWFKHKHKKHHKHDCDDNDDDDNGGGDDGGGDGDGNYGEPGVPLPLDGAGTYAYNANGELLSIAKGTDLTTYEVDEFGHLKAATFVDGAKINYLLDWGGRRVAKLVNDQPQYRRIYSSQLELAAEVKNDGSVSEFVFATSVNSADYMKQGTSHYRLIHDHLGSPRLVVNSLDGTIMQRLDYNEWGNVIADSNPNFQPFGFAGGLYDSDTKLTKFGARDYNPSVARWNSKDPILFAGGDTNLYRYNVSDSINLIDPEGTRPLTPHELSVLKILAVSAAVYVAYKATVLIRERLLDKINNEINSVSKCDSGSSGLDVLYSRRNAAQRDLNTAKSNLDREAERLRSVMRGYEQQRT